MSEPAPSAIDARHAWTLLPRVDPPKRPASTRIADFLEIYGCFDEATAREQASRCIVCAEPTCVTGCPLASPISEWMALTAEGRFDEAAALLHRSSCLPEISSRTCPADQLCEPLCLIEGRAEPVSIWAVEQFLHHYTFDRDRAAPDAPANGRSVAVIGATAGGLACADELVRIGYRVTVVDPDVASDDSLLSGIPGFRIERGLVQRRIENLRQRGVEFRREPTTGEGTSLDVLRSTHDAVYLGFKSRTARELDVPGATLQGVLQAEQFLLAMNRIPRDPIREQRESSEAAQGYRLSGRRVVVIGGSDTALDCARSAVRCGAIDVTCVYRRDDISMPCGGREYEEAREEGVKFIFETAAVEVLPTPTGTVAGLRLVRTKPGTTGKDGRRMLQLLPGTEVVLAADVVFLALGFDATPLPSGSGLPALSADESGRVVVDASMMTRLAGIFAGGDLIRGPAAPIHAVRDARRAAAGIHDYVTRSRAAMGAREDGAVA